MKRFTETRFESTAFLYLLKSYRIPILYLKESYSIAPKIRIRIRIRRGTQKIIPPLLEGGVFAARSNRTVVLQGVHEHFNSNKRA